MSERWLFARDFQLMLPWLKIALQHRPDLRGSGGPWVLSDPLWREARVLRAEHLLQRRWQRERDLENAREELLGSIARLQASDNPLAVSWRKRREHKRREREARRNTPLDVKGARERMAAAFSAASSPAPPMPPGATLVSRDPERWFHLSNVPEATGWSPFLHELLRDAPGLRSVVIERVPLGLERGGNTSVEGDDDRWWARVQLNSDIPTYSHEAERVLRHELAHLVHCCALGDKWPTLPEDEEGAEAFAVAMERELRAGMSAAAYMEMAVPDAAL